MYNAMDLIIKEIKEIEYNWSRQSPKNCGEIEYLIRKREMESKINVLNRLLKVLTKRHNTIVITKENTSVEWVDNAERYAIIRYGDFELKFDHIGYSYMRIIDEDDDKTEINCNDEGDFVLFDSCYQVPDFFIEKTLLLELSEKADTFMYCDECGNTLNECECCGECGKYECECEYCEHCGEHGCYGECQEDEDED